ncbi:hypothetical protein F5146DRAFT_1142512 [Armillaria mellea]|nr:hypothetical protein F5146DRAFT_1142512 [Armillaria mellea]
MPLPTMITEELAPIFGPIESIDILLRCWQAEVAAVKVDQDHFLLEAYAYEQANEYIHSLLSPDYLPPCAATKSIRSSRVLAASKIKTVLSRKCKADANRPFNVELSILPSEKSRHGAESEDPSSQEDINVI